MPKDILDSTIFALIGQYHIIDRKDWAPYEQAGYLYRTINKSNKTPELLASELGMKISDIKNYYQYMNIC